MADLAYFLRRFVHDDSGDAAAAHSTVPTLPPPLSAGSLPSTRPVQGAAGVVVRASRPAVPLAMPISAENRDLARAAKHIAAGEAAVIPRGLRRARCQ
jgi:hypothetical protein